MDNPITQSKEWKKLQDDLGETSFLVSEADFHYLAILRSTPVGKYLHLPYGPVAKDESSFKAALQSLNALASSTRAFFIRIEPQNTAIALPPGAHKSKDQSPAETWLLDLPGKKPLNHKDDEMFTDLESIPPELKAKLPSRLLRYYRTAGKKGITIERSHNPADIHYLLDLQKALGREKGISTFSESYLQTELKQPFATLYLFRLNEEGKESPVPEKPSTTAKSTADASAADSDSPVIAAGLVFDHGATRYNLQGAQSDAGRRLHATGILTIQLILDAYSLGLKTFDFWGIAPDGAPADHPWAGFTAFKKTFMGHERKYHGTYDLILSPIKYKIYTLLRHLNRIIKH